MSLLCEISSEASSTQRCRSCCSDVPGWQKQNKTQIGGHQRHHHSDFLFMSTGCFTRLLLETLSACSDDSYVICSSKMILQIQQLKKSAVYITDFKLLIRNYKIIITKCSAAEKMKCCIYNAPIYTQQKYKRDLCVKHKQISTKAA